MPVFSTYDGISLILVLRYLIAASQQGHLPKIPCQSQRDQYVLQTTSHIRYIIKPEYLDIIEPEVASEDTQGDGIIDENEAAADSAI